MHGVKNPTLTAVIEIKLRSVVRKNLKMPRESQRDRVDTFTFLHHSLDKKTWTAVAEM